MYSKHRASFEANLASAHRALCNAAEQASLMGSEGDEDDCRQLAAEVVRIAEASLKDKLRKPTPMQPRLL